MQTQPLIPTPDQPMASKEPVGNFQGVHLFAELYGIDFNALDDEASLRRLLESSIEKGGATICGVQTKKFDPAGVTMVVLLAESHLSIHTYPEKGCLFLDVFTCGSCHPRPIYDHIVAGLNPKLHNVNQIQRGQ